MAIAVKGGDLEMRIRRGLVGGKRPTISEPTVYKAGKATSIIGTGDTATFASLDFAGR